MFEGDPPRLPTSGAKSVRVLEELADRKVQTIRLPDDLVWLGEISPTPRKLLSGMKERGLIYSIAPGKYAVSQPGSVQMASRETMIDSWFGPRGPYYLGYLSALIGHRLTDLHSMKYFVAVPYSLKPRRAPEDVRVVRISEKSWPISSQIDRVRVFRGAKEFYFRSSVERTLVDVLNRPDLSAGMETVVSSWRVARDQFDVSWDQVAVSSSQIGDSALRRTAFMFDLLGIEEHPLFGVIEGRTANVLLDRSKSFDIPRSEMSRHPDTGIRINVPESYLAGWAGV